MTQIATLIFVTGTIGLFLLDPDRNTKTSKALWVPIGWLLIAGSRAVSTWFVTSVSPGLAQEISQERYMEGSPVDRAVYLLLLIAALAVVLYRVKVVKSIIKVNWPILLFVLYCALSISWSDYPMVATKRWFKSLADYSILLIMLTDNDRIAATKKVLARVAFVLLPASILLIKYYPELGRSYSKWEGTQFYTGVASDKNMLGMTCLVFGLAAWWRVLHEIVGKRRMRALVVHGTLLVMTIWLFARVNSVTSMSCFGMAAALMAAHTFFKIARQRAVIHLMVATVLVGSFSALFLSLGNNLLQTVGRDPTLTGRTFIWAQVLAIPVNPVVGTGFESFWLGKRMDYLWKIDGLTGINEAHNGYLETYLNLGWIGLAFVGVILVVGYRNILRLLVYDPEAGRLRLAYFVTGIVYDYSEAAIRTGDLVWIALLLAVMSWPKTSHASAVVAQEEDSCLLAAAHPEDNREVGHFRSQLVTRA